MERRQLVYLIGITVVSIAALVGTLIAGNEPLLGLDLQGGVSVRYRATEEFNDPMELQERIEQAVEVIRNRVDGCLLYTSPSPRDATLSRMPSSA